MNQSDPPGVAPDSKRATEKENSALQVVLLVFALGLMLASGFFATVALGVTPDDFAPKFTGSPNLVSNEDPVTTYIAVTVPGDTDVPPDWVCYDGSALARRDLTARKFQPGELLCGVPQQGAKADPEPKQDEGPASTNWAGWLAGVLGVAGALTAALTQHEKFPWSAASKLARANARRGLARVDEG